MIRRYLWVMVGVLLLAAIFRWHGLGTMQDMLMFDEAYNGWDALRLAESPHLTPFLPENNGRESGWHYFVLPFLLGVGVRPFTVHLAATMVGILTVAAIFRLGAEVNGRRQGLWAAASLAGLYWHVHLSHLGLRAILWPFVGAMAFASLFSAWRTRRQHRWIVAGIWIGLFMYTYFSARLWWGLAGLWLLWWLVSDKSRRGEVLLTIVTTVTISLPQLVYLYQNPELAMGRVSGVAIVDGPGVWANLAGWMGAWFGQGDANIVLNGNGRAILDAFIALPFLAGLVTLRQNWRQVWLVSGLFVMSLIPSLFSDYAPHFLRSLGMVVPVALVLGLGSQKLADWLSDRMRFAWIIPGLLLLISSGVGYRDFSTWLVSPEVVRPTEQDINRAARLIDEHEPEETAVYFAPFSPFHPNIAFIQFGQPKRHIGGFSSAICQVVSHAPAIYVAVPKYEPDFAARLAPWNPLTAWTPILDVPPTRLPDMLQSSGDNATSTQFWDDKKVVFDDSVQLGFLGVPTTVSPGDELTIWLAFRAVHPIPKVISAFVHLYGYPLPTEGGHLWTQSDSQICEPYPSTIWQPEETILQEFRLKIPADIPAGQYEIHVGTYESPAGARLPLTGPITNLQNSYPIAKIEVTSP